MADFLEQWAKQSEANTKLVAQETLITEVTEEIWKAMEEAGINKAELARKLGATKGYITQVLNGSRNMTLRTLSDICFALDRNPGLYLEPKETAEEWDTERNQDSHNWVAGQGATTSRALLKDLKPERETHESARRDVCSR